MQSGVMVLQHFENPYGSKANCLSRRCHTRRYAVMNMKKR